VRTLAEDIAAGLGSCAHLKNLRRIDVEPFRERDMISLEALENAVQAGKLEQILQPVDAGLVHWQWLELDAESAIRFSHGNPVETDSDKAGLIRVRDAAGKLLGIGEMTAQKLLKPRRIMHL